ncbi:MULTISPECIES: ATP-binding protein [Sphingobacterium]|uniref:ATP-binding protein n=1 Tax=Sphingobacterium athyrii TaxID=2152717 RepID=A0A363NQJ5_9SPHI|nr:MULTISPECIES: ATP-binding protein [Sphingobacterium]PUV23072.1 ATP-binding protein [Sphingobacterium athyrii]QIH31402.1 ATP-binding protein [Sphingobacterium sp. DR205]
MFLPRINGQDILDAIRHFPVTAIIGPRQCGKSTLVKHLMADYPSETLYLDLERPSDLEKLNDAEWFLSNQKDKLICIDEIQRKPELFPLLRSLVDEWNKPSCFVVLGSASRDLLMQSSESLAGRIIYKQLTPLLWSELPDIPIEKYFERGGFPRSMLAISDRVSFEWLNSFIATFLERDLLQWVNFTPATMRRLWQMLAHVNGQTVNYSTLGNSLGVSNQTVKNYIDLLKSTYMVDVVEPYISNMGKRLVKAPKVYISDSGIVSALLSIRSFEELSGHPAFGAIWETIVLANLRGTFPEAEICFYRTAGGAEIDFVIQLNRQIIAIECKASYSPTLSKGNHIAIKDIQPKHTFVVIPSSESWAMSKGIEVVSLSVLIKNLNKYVD